MTKSSLRFLAATAILALAAGAASAQTYVGGGFTIPDNDAAGAGTTINVADSFTLISFQVTIEFEPAHTFVGDLIAQLTHGPTTVFLFRQVGWTDAIGPGDSSNLSGSYTFIDSATTRLIDVAKNLDDFQTIAPGAYRATTNTFNGDGAPNFSGETVVSLNGAFLGANVNGAWTLNIADIAFGDEGGVRQWSITVAGVPEPSLVLVGGLTVVGTALAVRRRQRSGSARSQDANRKRAASWLRL